MRVPRSSPGEGPKKIRDHFPHWKIAGGEKHFAYTAGPVLWVIGHPSDKGTKPCTDWMTNGAVPCRLCALHKEPCEVGYVPVYRASDWRPLCVIVYDDERQWVDDLELHTRVQIGREREKGARLFVRPCVDQEPRFNSTVDYRRFPQEVDDSCLVMWKMPELVSWLRCRTPADNAVSLSLDAESVPAAVVPRPVADRIAAAPAVDDAVDRLRKRAKQAETNGDGAH